ncbi:MAG: twin-arginine translocation signal domain-containing protein [Pseudomonadales bacterium]|nr:twin-arginine translocation signal domain-containing protein [Pseudomonadales bacterium]
MTRGIKIVTRLQLARRDFLKQVSVLSGTAAVMAALPASVMAAVRRIPEQDSRRASPGEQDEALGNYPAYAEIIGFGAGHLPVTTHADMADQQIHG